MKNEIKNIKNDKFLKNIFSVINEKNHKVFTILGVKIKIVRPGGIKRLLVQQTDIINTQNKILNMLYDNFDQFYWRTSCINESVNHIFEYMTGIELNYDFIKEREILFNPQRAPLDHYKRYEFATKNISEQDKVADIACTCGYGTSILGKKAKEVVGIDLCEPVINFAKKVYGSENIRFYCQDAQQLTLDETFDKVISFETLEHIPDPKLFLNKVYKLLNEGGKIICSVPNETTRPWANEGNKFHFRHFTKEQLINLLRECGFETENIFQQYKENNYTIEKKETDGDMIIAVARKVKNNGEKYEKI